MSHLPRDTQLPSDGGQVSVLKPVLFLLHPFRIGEGQQDTPPAPLLPWEPCRRVLVTCKREQHSRAVSQEP